jgi:DNA invertase Pin-like site-specific DNA recombinase
MTHSLALAETLSDSNQAKFAQSLRKVESNRIAVICDIIRGLDTAERRNWRLIILAAQEAGITDDEIQRELGASASTVYRWKTEDVAPREGTRRLMRGALVRLVEQRKP